MSAEGSKVARSEGTIPALEKWAWMASIPTPVLLD